MGLLSCDNAPAIDENKVFRLNRYENVSSLDPAFARSKSNNWMSNLLYTGLVNFDKDLNIIPEVAKSWDISEDGKTYTFYLNQDIYFHPHPAFGADSTRTVIAKDFVYSFNRLKDPNIGSSGGFVLNNVEGYKALNDSTLQITLKSPFPPFLGLLCMKYCSVVPEEIFNNQKYKNDYIGTGPFKFQYWEDNVKLVLKRNDLFYKKDEKGKQLPYLEYVSIQFLPEKHSEFLELIQGKIDMMSSLDPSYKDELITARGVLSPKYQEDLVMIKAPYLNTEYLTFLMDQNQPVPLELRKAINMAIDKSKMIQFLRNNIGFPAHGGFIPKGLPGHQESLGDGYNPQAAKQLIENYRNDNGELPRLSLVTTQEYADICEFVQSELNKVSFPIQVNVVDPGTLRDGKANGKFGFFRANWGADYPDAENFLSLFYSENFAPNGPNYSHFKNQEFDALYQKSLQINHQEERKLIYQKMDSLVMNEMPVIPTFYDQSTTFLRKNIKGFNNSAIDMLDLTRVYKTKD
ncbi:ABC transporter substrate-binding protein [Flavobacteriaceae bacterium Ap0902]|nr:ABC transporter substrate-binding protein [Flavobacteriaceae bacterium Ap0902]